MGKFEVVVSTGAVDACRMIGEFVASTANHKHKTKLLS